MHPTYDVFRARLHDVILDKERQGHVVDGLVSRLDGVPDDYQRMADFGAELAELPLRDDWPYVEPNDIDGIRAEWTWDGSLSAHGDEAMYAQRAAAGFMARTCGCVLGKPVEIHSTLDELRAALESIGDWPLNDYISRRLRDEGALPRLHRSWPQSVREQISHVPADDDLHYTLLGLLTLERYGLNFTKADLYDQWINHIPIRWAFGPERTALLRFGLAELTPRLSEPDLVALADYVNPGEERCGALIRVDVYGYACAGRPDLAAELAWRDATLTHRRTGVYGAMFTASAIAAAFVIDDPLELFAHALGYVPRRSRFYRIVADSLEEVSRASDWEDGYRRIHGKYAEYTHCSVLQEVGTLMNTVRFAESSGHGICLQVSQGNDTDSFGATAGSLLGIRFGPDGLDKRWLSPFNDTIRTQLAGFHEQSLSEIAARIARLPVLGRAAGIPAGASAGSRRDGN